MPTLCTALPTKELCFVGNGTCPSSRSEFVLATFPRTIGRLRRQNRTPKSGRSAHIRTDSESSGDSGSYRHGISILAPPTWAWWARFRPRLFAGFSKNQGARPFRIGQILAKIKIFVGRRQGRGGTPLVTRIAPRKFQRPSCARLAAVESTLKIRFRPLEFVLQKCR